MSYPERLLNDDESVIVDLHPHWWFLAPPTAAVVLAIGAGVATLVETDHGSTARTVATWGSIAVIALSVMWLVVRYCRWLSTSFVITDHRVIFRSGVLAKHGVEIPLDRVQTVHFSQGIWERLVGAGDLVIESGGEGGVQHFTDIRQPDRVQRALHAQLSVRRDRRSSGWGHDVAGQLERLHDLRERGAITDDEYERHKQRLLDP